MRFRPYQSTSERGHLNARNISDPNSHRENWPDATMKKHRKATIFLLRWALQEQPVSQVAGRYTHRAGQLVTRIADAELHQQRQLAEAAGKAARKAGNPNIEPDSYETVLVKVVEDSAIPIPE